MTFDEFVDAQLAALLRFAGVLCADRGLAEDIVQDVFIRAQARWPRIESMDHHEAYVRRMIVNDFLSWRRRLRTIPVADVPEQAQPDHTSRFDDQQQLVAELAKLPRRQRAVLVLRYFGGLSDVEIADELGCGASTVRSHMSRGLRALRVEMTGELAAEKGS